MKPNPTARGTITLQRIDKLDALLCAALEREALTPTPESKDRYRALIECRKWTRAKLDGDKPAYMTGERRGLMRAIVEAELFRMTSKGLPRMLFFNLTALLRYLNHDEARATARNRRRASRKSAPSARAAIAAAILLKIREIAVDRLDHPNGPDEKESMDRIIYHVDRAMPRLLALEAERLQEREPLLLHDELDRMAEGGEDAK